MTRAFERAVPMLNAITLASVPLFPAFITLTNVAFPGISIVPLPVALVLLATMVLFALWAGAMLLATRGGREPTVRPLLAWWAAGLLATILGLNPRDGAIFLCIFGLGVVWHAGILRWYESPRFMRFTFWAYLLSGTLATLLALAMVVTRTPAAQYAVANGRAVGTFVLPGELAGYCILFVPIAYALARVARSTALRGLAWVGVACGLAAMVASFSRTGWMGLACAIGFFVALQSPQRNRGAAVALAIVLGTLALVLLLFNVQHNPSENYTRLSIWQAAIGAIDRMPLTGAGPFGFSHLYPIVRLPDGDATAFHAHSMYLTILAELGAVGFGAFVWTLWTFAAEFRRRLARAEPAARMLAVAIAAGIVGSLVQGLIDTVSVIIFGLLLPMLALALAVARSGPVDA